MADSLDLKIALAAINRNLLAAKTPANYYAGNHVLNFATEKFKNAFGRLFQTFADNLCTVPVDALADRLQIETFDAGTNAELAQKAEDIWAFNRMDRRAGEVHTEAATVGDAYVIVWPDKNDRARVWLQNTGTTAVFYDEDNPDEVAWAAKRWVMPDGRMRVNLYYPEQIERYVTRNAGTEGTARAYSPYAEDGDEPVITNPFGRVPVFHFPNNASTGSWGRSELADIIPLQDALNKSISDMLVAMEFVALPQRYATGLTGEFNPETGLMETPKFSPGADRVWTAQGDAAFGQFAQADLSQFLEVQNGFRTEIARIGGLPLHYVEPGNGTPPSGEALKVAEARLVKKAKDRQMVFGVVWADIMGFCCEIEGAGAEAGQAISVTWENPETRDDLSEVQTQLLKQQLGVSQDQSLRELGYSPEDIERMKEEKAYEASVNSAAADLLASRDDPVSGAQARAALEASTA